MAERYGVVSGRTQLPAARDVSWDGIILHSVRSRDGGEGSIKEGVFLAEWPFRVRLSERRDGRSGERHKLR